ELAIAIEVAHRNRLGGAATSHVGRVGKPDGRFKGAVALAERHARLRDDIELSIVIHVPQKNVYSEQSQHVALSRCKGSIRLSKQNPGTGAGSGPVPAPRIDGDEVIDPIPVHVSNRNSRGSAGQGVVLRWLEPSFARTKKDVHEVCATVWITGYRGCRNVWLAIVIEVGCHNGSVARVTCHKGYVAQECAGEVIRRYYRGGKGTKAIAEEDGQRIAARCKVEFAVSVEVAHHEEVSSRWIRARRPKAPIRPLQQDVDAPHGGDRQVGPAVAVEIPRQDVQD